MKNELLKATRCLCIAAAAFGTGAQAAERLELASLAEVDGKVLVNKGKGFVTARSGMQLSPGDRIISLDGSRAAVIYADGCVTQLKENSLLALQRTDRCGKEALKTGASPRMQPVRYAEAIGGTRTDGVADAKGGPNPWWAAAGAGGVGLAIRQHYRNVNNNDRPISNQ